MVEQEFFTVHHALTVNIEPLDEIFEFPEESIFEAEIPAPFIVASEFSELEHASDLVQQEMKNSDFNHIVQLLDAQNSKLNLLLSFMLAQQDDDRFRHQTVSFGASQFTYLNDSPLTIGTKVRAKLFLNDPAAAIYTYGTVSDSSAHHDVQLITVKYVLLRDCDQDLLIRAALHQQQRLLKERSIQRNQ